MSHPPSRSPSTSPSKNTSANYESAAREIEQEKQMVAALKRLSIGHMMHLDPDIPSSEASFSFLMDRELQNEDDFYSENIVSSKNASEIGDFSNSDSDHEQNSQLHGFSGSNSASPEYSHPSSSGGEESHHEGLLWVPANMHPEVNPQQFKNHVRTTMDELLERKLSRSKSANRSKRSSLSLSTTDDFADHEEKQDTKTHERDSVETRDVGEYGHGSARNRLSNPSLSRLTSELQTMSRLAGMDSNDAVTLARSLSTSSLGYSDVERTAIDDLEHANAYAPGTPSPEFRDSSYGSPGIQGNNYHHHNPHQQQQQQYQHHQHQHHQHHQQHQQRYQRSSPGNSPRPNGSGVPAFPSANHRQNSAHRPVQGDQTPQFYNQRTEHRSNEDFSLRRSRRVDYRKSPTVSSSGSQLQSNKAGKLAQLRHNLSSSSLQSTGPEVSMDRVAVGKHAGNNSRSSMRSINPRSSQVLFSYKSPNQPVKSASPQAQGTAAPLVETGSGLSVKDSPYSSAITSDTLGRNIHPTKYTNHNLTTKTLAASGGSSPSSPTFGKQASSYRSSSREQDPQTYEMREVSWKSRAASPHGGHRQISPTSHQSLPSTVRVSSREGPMQNPGRKRYPPSSSGNSPAYQQQQHHQQHQQQQHHSPRIISGETLRGRPFSKRDKTRELNQNLDLLRNEINEFKESLSAKTDPKSKKTDAETETGPDAQIDPAQEKHDPQTDFSFDLTNQDVSYEDPLEIEGDVLKDLEAIGDEVKQQHGHVTTVDASNEDEIVSIPESGGVEGSSFRDTVTQDAGFSQQKHTESELNSEEEIGKSVVSEQEKIREESARESVGQNLLHESPKLGKYSGHSKKADKHNKATNLFTEEKKPEQDASMNVDIKDEKDTHQNRRHASGSSTQSEEVAQQNEASRQSTMESWDNQEKQSIRLSSESTGTKMKSAEKKKSKKTWPWSKEKSSKSQDEKTSKEVRSPVRSVSSPEMAGLKSDAPLVKEEQSSKENAITKFFKKRRSSSVSHDRHNSEHFSVRKSTDSSENDVEIQSHGKSRVQRHSRSSEKSGFDDLSSQESGNKDLKRENSNEETKQADDHRVTSRLKTRIKNMKKIHEEKEEKPISPAATPSPQTEEIAEEDAKPKSTIEVQEKLKKAIKRYSRPNQPIEFTDSAFGFPLPPPSSSTLVMIDYRFPVHVERAIYRLSHLKLANPKRSLREQVILSNFMYAYLNLVDHTLHLEQQMTTEECEIEQPEADLDFMGDQDVDTEFETDDGFEESDFDSIKIDLDVKENPSLV